ncbi:MAG: FAD-binding oxidoreductase [Alphaproteobacteria bacterium]|nr:FAD-binding oxidoreductase [Alphaproteobacteria bacterium]
MRVAIVGGGIAGVSAAAALAEGGAQVTLFEAEEALGYHASGRSSATYAETYGNATIRALNRVSRRYLDSAGLLTPRGIMLVALADEEDAFERDLDDMDLTEIAPADAQARVPILAPGIVRAATHDSALDIDTHGMLMGLARKARQHGAEIITGTAVETVRAGWIVETRQGAFEADVVINAAGAWADRIAALAGVAPIGLQPYRRSMARMPAPGGHDVRDWPMLFGPGESWYAKPDAGGWIVSPADEDPAEPMDAWADDMVLAEGIARYETHVTEPVLRIETNWAGLRSFAPDRTLVIGAAPGSPGFFWLAGQGGYGIQTAPAAAAHLAHLVMASAPVVDEKNARDLSPDRFE